MPNYELAEAAEADLQNIALYTISKWGPKQAARYGIILDSHFEAIGTGRARSRIFLPHRPELRVSHVEHYYSFIWTGKSGARSSWPCSTRTWIS